MKRRLLLSAALAWLAAESAAGAASIAIDRVACRFPWNGLVDIDYTLEGTEYSADYVIDFTASATVGGTLRTWVCSNFTDRVFCDLPTEPGSHRVTWNAQEDSAGVAASDLTITAQLRQAPQNDGEFMIVDLSAGSASGTTFPVRYVNGFTDTSIFNRDEYKTTRMVLKKVRRGTFLMGSADLVNHPELGTYVKLTRDFFLGIFPVTQGQEYQIIGRRVTSFANLSTPDLRAEERFTWGNYFMNDKGIMTNLVTRLRYNGAEVEGFDMPTEAQWEYATRAGTRTYYWFGDSDANAADYAWNKTNGGECTQPVGLKPSNPWGFYEQCGNVREFCWSTINSANPGNTEDDPVEDPPQDGPAATVRRSGCYEQTYWYTSKSGYRTTGGGEGGGGNGGLRFACTLPAGAETTVHSVPGTVVSTAVSTPVAVDMRSGPVHVIADAAAMLPLSYNNSLSWTLGGASSVGAPTLTVTPMTGTDPADPTTWETDGNAMALETTAGEGTVSWLPARASLFRAILAFESGDSLTAHYDLRSATGLAKSIASATVTLSQNTVYFDGTAQEPAVTVTDGSAALAEGTDYTLRYEDNVVPGTARVLVTGIGAYGDEKQIEFAIVIRTWTGPASAAARVDLDTNAVREVANVTQMPPLAYNNTTGWIRGGSDTLGLASIEARTMLAESGDEGDPSKWTETADYEPVPVSAREGTVQWEPPRQGLYRLTLLDGQGGSVTAHYDLRNSVGFKKNLVDEGYAVALEKSSVYFDGTEKTPTVTVSNATEVLTEGTDYTVVYSNNRGDGTATVTVTGKGGFVGSLEEEFEIVLRGWTAGGSAPVDLRDDAVLAVTNRAMLFDVAWNSTNAWLVGGAAEGKARVSYAPLADAAAEPDETQRKTLAYSEGEGTCRQRICPTRFVEYRLDYPDGTGTLTRRLEVTIPRGLVFMVR